MTAMIDPALLAILRCPASGQPLRLEDGQLVSADASHRYDIVDGIPCLIPAKAVSTHQGYSGLMEVNKRTRDADIDLEGYINGMLVPTCGNLFRGVKLSGAFPIPDLPRGLPGGFTLDIGCNWGRWSVAGALAGRSMVGVDIHLESLMVARELARRLSPDNQPHWVLADARHLPFAQESFDASLSYSVVQHFSRADAAMLLGEMGRVLKKGGAATVQMPNVGGLKARLTMGQRRFDEGTKFDVRYYTIDQLLAMFGAAIGPARWDVDCYLGLNVHAKDKPLLPLMSRAVINAAELCRLLSRALPGFGRLADSVWIAADKV